jgi:cytochrome c-type biogenesis protein CcmH
MARSGVAEARTRGNLPAATASGKAPAAATTAQQPAGPAAAAAVVSGAITGTVTLAPALKGRVGPDDAIFVFARAATGSRMPVAFMRAQVKDLPLNFTLDDSMAMSPAARLSTAGQVVVGARVSKSGQAMPQAGDLEGLSEPTAAGSVGVNVVIAGEVK